MRRGPPMRRLRSGILCRLQLRLLPLVGRLPDLLGSSAFRLRWQTRVAMGWRDRASRVCFRTAWCAASSGMTFLRIVIPL